MNDVSSTASRLSALVDMGFEVVSPGAPPAELVRVDDRTLRLTSHRPAMGTLVSVIAVGRSRDRLEEAVGRSFGEMERLITMFSRFETASAVTTLNDAGRLTGPPPELRYVVARARRYHALTRGAFDVTVEPLVELLRQCGAVAGPSTAEIRAALEHVGSENVTVGRREIGFRRSGMRVTLDGIAKGYIVDAMAKALRRRGVRRFLVNAGGDIRMGGPKESGRPWTIAVEDPSKRGPYPDSLRLVDGAVATSGGYEQYFDPERRRNHLVDARTGHSPDGGVGVSVLAPSAMAADALATAVVLLPPAAGVALVDSLRGCACLIVTSDGHLVRSRRWRGAGPIHRGESEA